MIVSVMYQVGDGHKFDMDYYLKVHMPLVGSLMGPAGLKEAQVLRAIGSPDGGPATYQVIALLDFESVDAFKAAAEAHGAAVFGDIPNFTDVQPALQFNERVGYRFDGEVPRPAVQSHSIEPGWLRLAHIASTSLAGRGRLNR